MRLKEYQTKALETLSAYLALLGGQVAQSERRAALLGGMSADDRKAFGTGGDPVEAAWVEARGKGIAASPDDWRPMADETGRAIAHICMKLPTGGGKTLLAAHGVERISVDYFRRSTGLVLWIVPSDAIYTQTRKLLADRGSAIRQVLDRMSGGRVKVLEKLDGFTAHDIADKLCVLLLMLPSANRENRETLRFFRDSGRYESFFPQDDATAEAALTGAVPNLERIDLSEAAFGGLQAGAIKHSLGNALRIVRPIVILDEGHHAYGKLARETLATLNPCFILEMTATPKREFANILVNVPGTALKDEEMIKLPIRLETEEKLPWQDTLRRAIDRLDALETEAQTLRRETNRYIRPILLVRVDLTGKDTRDAGGARVHSEDVYEYLTQQAGFHADAVRRQTAELKELKDDDLLSEYCGVRAIITKDALREGWDCPFAYVLAVLSSGTAPTALTQMIGRILRQPHAARTGHAALDQAYVFCKDLAVGEAVDRIKKGLEIEGMGDLADAVDAGGREGETHQIEVRIRDAFRGARIMVPRVLHREGGKDFRELGYERDILSAIDWDRLRCGKIDSFVFADYDVGRRTATSVDIAGTAAFAVTARQSPSETVVEAALDKPALVRRMLDVVPNPWQGMRILDEVLETLERREDYSLAKLIAAKFQLIAHMLADLREQLDAAAEEVFRRKVAKGDIVFKLLAPPDDRLNFVFDDAMTVTVSETDLPLFNSRRSPLERALYDKVFARDVNGYEKDVALYMDDSKAVRWWWRIVSRRDWKVQGWRRANVYPDFLVKLEADGRNARLLVLETKGSHLDNADTAFKTKLFALLEQAYDQGKDAGDVELFADRPQAMRFRILLQDASWKSALEQAIG